MNAILLGAVALSITSAAPAADTVPLYSDLGDHHTPVSTASPAAQRYFDQGMRLYYAFNHAEAERAFREATRQDPDCAMCYWGVALTLGPNINAPMDAESGMAALAAVREAVARSRSASPREQDLVRALSRRYGDEAGADRAALDSAWTLAMREVVARHPGDQEAAVLYAESLMTLRPWNYWTREGRPQPGTLEALGQLEWVLAVNPRHPGACHFYIHAVEAVTPEKAVACAERLASLMPGAGHLVHMPGHIYIRVGRYLDAIHANEHAIHADETYIRDQRPGLGMYTAGYYPHNYDFLAFAAAMAGRRSQALDAADRVRSLIPEELLAAPGMTFLQHFSTRGLQMRVRFGLWDQILAAPMPADGLLHALGMWHYARGRAGVALGDPGGARTELARLEEVIRNPALEGVALDLNESRTVLRIAARVLEGRIAAAEGRFDEGVRHLTEAAAMEDGLLYMEPPEWSIPVRHDLGAVLLAAERPAEAEEAYRQDLARFPENGWALKGLARALEAQGRRAEASEVEARLVQAWSGADVQLPDTSF
jgi:tetratricopeptide (TPR) repeat protein